MGDFCKKIQPRSSSEQVVSRLLSSGTVRVAFTQDPRPEGVP